jgi:hypothetical protein
MNTARIEVSSLRSTTAFSDMSERDLQRELTYWRAVSMWAYSSAGCREEALKAVAEIESFFDEAAEYQQSLDERAQEERYLDDTESSRIAGR